MKFKLLSKSILVLMLAIGLQSSAYAVEKTIAKSAEEISPVLTGTVIPDAMVTSIEGKKERTNLAKNPRGCMVPSTAFHPPDSHPILSV